MDKANESYITEKSTGNATLISLLTYTQIHRHVNNKKAAGNKKPTLSIKILVSLMFIFGPPIVELVRLKGTSIKTRK